MGPTVQNLSKLLQMVGGVQGVKKKKVCIIGTFFHETYFKKNIKSHILNYSI
jgi:hypothetical protein